FYMHLSCSDFHHSLCVYVSFFFLTHRPTPRSCLFPYTTLFRSVDGNVVDVSEGVEGVLAESLSSVGGNAEADGEDSVPRTAVAADRKSTRLNSSHVSISYAVFCLKKKNKKP